MPKGMDQVADKGGAELARLSDRYAFPDFVKSADFTTTLEPGRLAATAYADASPGAPQFPCHTAASTWLSALFFQEKRAQFHPKDQARIGRCIDEYAAYHGITPAVSAMRARWSELHKSAETARPDSSYAYVVSYEDGTKERHLPVTNTMEVKAAAEWLEKYRDRVPYDHRVRIAGRIIEKAAAYGAALGPLCEFVERQAGRGVCDPAEVASMIRERALLAKNAEVRDQIVKLAASVAETPRQALQPDRLVKLASTVYAIDKGVGLGGNYGGRFRHPEDVIFGVTFTKAAADLQSVVATTSGKVYEKAALSRLSLDDVRGLLGDEFAERVRSGLSVDPEKMAEEAATLPRPDAEMLDGLLSDNGVAPVMNKAASAPRLSDEQWRDLAMAYGG